MGVERDELAAHYFPQQWAAIATLPGASKKRQQLRKAAETRRYMIALRAEGARCGTCNSYTKMPHDDRMYCAAKSDFSGYTVTFETSLCGDWSAKPKSQELP